MNVRMLFVLGLFVGGCATSPLADSRVVTVRKGRVYLGSVGPFIKMRMAITFA